MAQTDLPPLPAQAREVFNSVGKAYQVAFADLPIQDRSLAHLLATLPAGAKVLDVGSGTGRPACARLSAAGFNVTGIDLSPAMIAAAREQVPGVTFIEADARTWEPAGGDGHLDAVVAYFSFIGGVTQDDIAALFTRAFRWLRPGGVFHFGTVPAPGDRVEVKWMGRMITCSGFDVQGTLQHIREAGFEIVKHEEEKFMPRGEAAGLCRQEEVWEEDHVVVYAKKP